MTMSKSLFATAEEWAFDGYGAAYKSHDNPSRRRYHGAVIFGVDRTVSVIRTNVRGVDVAN